MYLQCPKLEGKLRPMTRSETNKHLLSASTSTSWMWYTSLRHSGRQFLSCLDNGSRPAYQKAFWHEGTVPCSPKVQTSTQLSGTELQHGLGTGAASGTPKWAFSLCSLFALTPSHSAAHGFYHRHPELFLNVTFFNPWFQYNPGVKRKEL